MAGAARRQTTTPKADHEGHRRSSTSTAKLAVRHGRVNACKQKSIGNISLLQDLLAVENPVSGTFGCETWDVFVVYSPPERIHDDVGRELNSRGRQRHSRIRGGAIGARATSETV